MRRGRGMPHCFRSLHRSANYQSLGEGNGRELLRVGGVDGFATMTSKYGIGR
jgi:hypothetical protein